jgi:metal-sulfur cluster biosynthetic enzyme
MSQVLNQEEIKQRVIKHIQNVYDPEIPVNIYDLGLIYNIEFEEKNNYLHCYVTMTLTSPACPVAESLLEQVKYVTLAVEQIDEAYVKLTFEPPWDKSKMSEEALEVMGATGAVI